jgi:hypothetical protein
MGTPHIRRAVDTDAARQWHREMATLTPESAQRVFDTPESVWVPTPQELLAGKVIKRVNH